MASKSHAFQSTRPYGARPRCDDLVNMTFQSTRPYGARRIRHACSSALIDVSIHAPVRGATRARVSLCDESASFQSTRPYGARHCGDCTRKSDEFQSTRPYGARRTLGTQSTISTTFQSTRPYGARRSMGHHARTADQFVTRDVSIHAPVRGAT